MKSIYRIFCIVLLTVVFNSVGKAQDNRFGLTYSTALPLGNTADYISNYSFRGIGIDMRFEVTYDLFLGISSSWNVFYDDPSGSFENGTRTFTGRQYRYVNTLPLMATVFKHFDNDGSFIPYLGTGIGLIYSNYRTEMGLFSVESKDWQFGLSPEVGIIIPTIYTSDVILSVRYNYGFETTDLEATSALAISLGLLF